MRGDRADKGAAARWAIYAVLLLAVLLLSACRTAFIGRAERDYTEGRYLEVAEELARYEDRLHTIPRTKQARYGLYRALALLKLGDYEGTAEWFAFVEDIERAGPTLNPERQALLEAGQRELAAMLRLQSGQPPGPPPNTPGPDTEPSDTPGPDTPGASTEPADSPGAGAESAPAIP